MKNNLKVLAFAIIIALAGFTGCNDKNTDENNITDLSETEVESENNSEDDVINLTVWSESSNFDTMNKMIENFKEIYEDEAEFNFTLAESSDSKTKDILLADIHNGADIFPIPDDQMTALVAAGVLEPIPNSEVIKNENTEESVAAASIDGVMYAYPMTADNGYFLYYDKRFISDSQAETMDSILAACEAAGKKFTMEFTSGWYLYSFFGNTGMEFGLNDDGVTNYCNWNTTEGDIKGVDIVQSLLDISANPAFLSCEDVDFLEGVRNGTIAAGVNGVWNAIEIQNAWGDDYGACKLPTYTCNGKQIQMSSFTGYKMMGVNYYCENKDWAYKFAEYITNEENQTLRFIERNQGPSNINAAASDEVIKVPAIAAVIEQSEFGKLQRIGNKFWTPFADFGKIIVEGNPEGINHQELIDELVKDITASVVD